MKIIIVILMKACMASSFAVNQIEEQTKVIKVDESSTRTLRLSEFAEEVKYIPLETNDKCLMATPVEYQLFNNRIYLSDLHGNNGIYCFDIDGKFISKRTKVGRGQGVFNMVQGLEVNRVKNDICIRLFPAEDCCLI